MYTRTLSLLYDKNDVVEKLVRQESSRPISKGMAGMSVGTPFVVTDWIVKGRTTTNTVIQVCGTPDFKTFSLEGQLVLGWIYASRPRTQMTTGVDRFIVLVDDFGRVRDFKTIAASIR
jgi:hypothetical protein